MDSLWVCIWYIIFSKYLGSHIGAYVTFFVNPYYENDQRHHPHRICHLDMDVIIRGGILCSVDCFPFELGLLSMVRCLSIKSIFSLSTWWESQVLKSHCEVKRILSIVYRYFESVCLRASQQTWTLVFIEAQILKIKIVEPSSLVYHTLLS